MHRAEQIYIADSDGSGGKHLITLHTMVIIGFCCGCLDVFSPSSHETPKLRSTRACFRPAEPVIVQLNHLQIEPQQKQSSKNTSIAED